MNVTGRTILLTGASGGIGHAIARRLAASGAQLVLSGRRTDVLEPLAAELGGRSVAVDLAERDAVAQLARDCATVDVLVANAALPASGQLFSFSVDEIDRALEVNLRAPIVLARELGEEMASRGSGHLVFVSSLAGKSGQPGSSVYSATKFGLRGFAQGLREDLRPRGVGVSAVFPGFIRGAGMFHDSGTQLPRGVGTSTPEEVADAVLDAIEHDRGEIDVAPVGMRVATKFAGLAPGVSATLSRRMGATKVADQLGSGQSNKR
jgi:short-subunit dehydrogenase